MLVYRPAGFCGIQCDLQDLFHPRSAGAVGVPDAVQFQLQGRTEGHCIQAARRLMTMHARLFRVVTFSADPGRGNPSFVLTDADGASDRTLTAACAMLGADIIAVAGA